MRHGFSRRSKPRQREPAGGLGGSWLAQVDYAYEGRSDIERSYFTLVLTEAAKSNEYAVRVLCHDRRLSKRDRANPDADREVVELDDQAVSWSAAASSSATRISTDHDQDQLSVWRLFDSEPDPVAHGGSAGGVLVRAAGRRALLLHPGDHRR